MKAFLIGLVMLAWVPFGGLFTASVRAVILLAVLAVGVLRAKQPVDYLAEIARNTRRRR